MCLFADTVPGLPWGVGMGGAPGSLKLPGAMGAVGTSPAHFREADGAFSAHCLPPARLKAGSAGAPRRSPYAPVSGCPR